MKITKEELVKVLKECGFKTYDGGSGENENWFIEGCDNEIEIDKLLEILEKIPERKEEIKPHKHNWQFVEKHNNDYGKVYSNTLEFVCECGATKRVLEKEVEL